MSSLEGLNGGFKHALMAELCEDWGWQFSLQRSSEFGLVTTPKEHASSNNEDHWHFPDSSCNAAE